MSASSSGMLTPVRPYVYGRIFFAASAAEDAFVPFVWPVMVCEEGRQRGKVY